LKEKKVGSQKTEDGSQKYEGNHENSPFEGGKGDVRKSAISN
jgi:hypothetical protein